jgi:hypothetical protein
VAAFDRHLPQRREYQGFAQQRQCRVWMGGSLGPCGQAGGGRFIDWIARVGQVEGVDAGTQAAGVAAVRKIGGSEEQWRNGVVAILRVLEKQEHLAEAAGRRAGVVERAGQLGGGPVYEELHPDEASPADLAQHIREVRRSLPVFTPEDLYEQAGRGRHRPQLRVCVGVRQHLARDLRDSAHWPVRKSAYDRQLRQDWRPSRSPRRSQWLMLV